MKQKQFIFALVAMLLSFVPPAFAQVAKVGNTEYATINEAIAKWTDGTTLTLLADVTLSDVVTLKSTEHHILNLGTYTMTAASGKNAFEITCEGRSSASYAITVNADATNPGGITADGKACIYYSKSGSTKDRPIIRIYNGVFNGSYSINSKSNGNTNCPQIWIYGGTFNGNVNLTKNMLRVFGGTFNGWINCTGDSSAYREISGGTFKSWQFMTADADTKFWVGTSKANYNVGVHVDDNGYLVVGGDVVTEPGNFEASSANYGGWSSYLKYSSAKDNGLYYTSVKEALADNNTTSGKVTVYVEELDLTGINFKGTIVVPEGKTVKITNAPEGLKTEGNAVIVKPVAKIGDVEYMSLEEAFAAATEGQTITLMADATPALASQRAITKAAVIDLGGKTMTLTEDDLYFGTTTFKNGTIVVDPSVKPSTAVFWMFANQTLTFDKVKVVATGVTGTYLIGLDGNNSDLNLLNGSEILVENSTALDLDIICVNATTGNDINVENSKVNVKNLDGRVFFRGNYTVNNSEVNLSGITKAGFRIEAGQTLSIDGTSKVNIEGEPRDGGIHLTDVTAQYTKAETATVNATVNKAPWKVSTKAELDAALAAANDGDVITLTADIDYGTTQLAITKAITLDLGGKTLTTGNAYGGMSIKGNPTVKNGNIIHKSNTAAIKVWNATAFEDLVIDVQGKGDANKTIGGIVLQSGSTTRVGSIKNVTIKGAALTNGIETYNCGDATENVIGSMEKVTIDAKGTGLLISAPCGTATDCSIKGGTNAIEIWIKGNYSASLDLVSSTVEGGVYAHDEFSSNPDLVNNGTIKFTADEATTGAKADDVTLTLARAEKVEGVLKEVKDNAKAKIGNTYYATLAAAIAAVRDGETITLVSDVTEDLTTTKKITIDGAGKTYTGAMTLKADATFKNVNFDGKGFNGYAITTRGAQYLTIEGGSAKNYGYGFVQLASATALTTVKNVTVSDMNYGVKVDYSSAVALENVDITAGVAAVLNSNYGGKTITVKNSKLNILGTWKRNDTIKTTYVFEGANTVAKFITEDALDNFKLAAGATLTAPEGKTVTTDVVNSAVQYKDGAYTVVPAVAKAGNVCYLSLQDAINAVQNGDTVTILTDIKENVTLEEKAGLYYTIDGADKTMDGTITVTPLSDTNDNRRITIKNIKFVNTADAGRDFISSVATNHYPRLTVEDCNFTGNGKGTDVAVRLKSSHSVVIKNCTATGMHSFIQNTSGWNLTIENVKVTDSKSGFALGTVQGVTVKGSNVDVAGYGIRLDAQYNNNAVLESNTVKAFIPVVVRKASVNSNVTVQGTNTMTATNTDGLWCAVGTSEYEANGTMPTAATGKVSVVLDDAKLPAEGVYGNYFGGTWGGIDWTLTNQGVLTIAPTTGTPVADKNCGKTYEVGAWREAVRYNSKGEGVAIEGWPYDRAKVKTLIIKEGVTSIGSFAAQSFTNLTGEVVIPSTVKYIGQEAFQKSTMTKLTFAEGGSEELCIAQGAFKNLLIEEVSLPADRPVHLHAWVFNNCHNLKTAHIPASVVSVHGTNHIDYFKDFNAHSNPTWTKSSEIFAYNENMETITFGSEEVRDMFYSNNNGTSKDYIVATTGLTSYSKIADAIAAVNENGGTIKLYKNVTLADTWTIPAGKDVTLDLNGKTISQTKACTASYEMINNKGNLNIVGSGKLSFKDTSAGDPNFGWGSYTVRNEGNLVVEKATIEHLGAQAFGTHCIMALYQYAGSTTINGGTISTPNYRSARLWKGNMTINGGTFDGQVWAQAVDNSANLVINGGTFEPNGNDASAVFVTNNQYDVKFAVSNGTFNGKVGCSDAAKLAGAIKGGKFNEAAKNGTNSALLAAGSIFGAVADANGYFAIEDDPTTHYIANLDDLKAFRDAVNSGANYYAGVNVYLAADIDMADENWVGIGTATADHGFMGNFDGQGYKIKNLTITNPALDSDGYAYAGLFGVTEGKDKDNQNTIKNLTIENVTINTTGQIAAAAIAYPYYTIVDNVKVCGDIKIQGGNYTAGVLAYTRRCVNASNLSIVGKDGSFVKGNQTVGGVISDIQMNGGLTAVYKNFSAENLTITGAKQVGGISGIIATQTLTGASVKNVALECSDARVGIVAGCLGGTSTISNVTYENVTGAATLIGASYDNAKAVAAKIGDTYYATLETAYKAAQAGATVELLAPVVIASGETLTLDKDVTVVYTSNVAGEDMFTNRGTLNISAGTITYANTDATGSNVTVSTISSEPGSVLNITGGTVENKTVKADGSSIYSYAIDMLTNGSLGDVTATISGGTVSSDYMAIRQFNNGDACKNTLTITDGYIYGAKRAVQVHLNNNAAYTTISGGKVEAGADGYAICNFAATGNLEVTGGEFIGAVYSACENFISGGTYNNPVEAAYCAAGYMPNKNANGTYGVVVAEDVYASINGVTYGSLKAAVAAAKAGETITLLQDVNENVTFNKNLTLDGADKTITGMITTDGKSLKVTIKNVHFDGNNRTINYAMRADDDLNLVVDNCSASNYLYGFLYANKSNDKIVVKNVTVKNCAEYGAYLVAFNNATFENFTVKGNTKYGIAVANSGARTVNLKNVTFEGAEQPLHINELGTAKVTFNFSGINDMSKAEYYTSEYVNVVAVAQVGTKVCGSLQDAVVAAKDGETVKVLADVNMTTANFVTQVDGYATLVNVAGKAVTIDLNGKKVTVNAADADLNGKAKGNMLMSVFHADPNGTLTLTDSSAEGTGTVELFANDATVYGLIVSENAYDKSNPGKIIVNGGNYIADKLSDSMIFADINEVITVNGGNFHLGNVGTGDNGKPWIFNTTGQNQIHINVNGGTYNANVAKQYYRYEVKLGEGLATTNNGDGTWTVVPGVAAVGEELFGSIQEAIDAAQNGETVTLIADVALDTKKYTTQVDNLVVLFNVKGKAVTFDLNGKKIEVNASAANLGGKMLAGVFSADVEGDFTITDSSAEGTGAVTVTVNDAKVYSVFISENAGDKTKSGKMTVNAGNFTTVGKVANAIIFADTDKVVTINGGTFICDGVSASENYPWLINTYGNNEIQVTVNGGTFNIDVNHQYRPFEVFVPENLAVKNNGDGTWTVVPAEAYVTEMLGTYVNEPGSREHKVGYATLEEAIAAAKTGETVTMVKNAELTESIVNTKTVTLNLNGKIVVATDNATGSYAVITNKGNLTINDATGKGAIKLTATNNRGWNAYSSVISNTVGGKLTVNGGTIEHLGGTDMAYAIDNLTNGKGTYAETVINGGYVKSTYRAVRQFLNGIEAQNILTVNGGTIEGTNKSIWMQDPSKNANTGTLTVSEDASLNGDVYLTVTAGSTEWPVEVSIAAAALEGESKVLSSNVPAGFAVTNFNGVYSVKNFNVESELTIVDGEYENFSIELAEPVTIETLTYKRTFRNTGAWQTLYVPFEIPVSELADNYEVAYVNDVQALDWNEDGTVGLNEITVEYVKIKNGGILKANHPYVIKPLNDAAKNMELVLYDAKLHGTSAEKQIAIDIATAYTKFYFKGILSKTPFSELGTNAFTLNTSGLWQAFNPTVNLGAFRVYLTMESKDGSPVIIPEGAEIRSRVVGEKDEATGIITPIVDGDVRVNDGTIFDLMGRPVRTPEKGKIYIMNGKKVLF